MAASAQTPALAEFVAGGGVLEGAQVLVRDLLPPGRGGGAVQDLELGTQVGAEEGRVADRGGVAGGVGEDLADVPVGVVVGEDRAVGVGRHAGGAEVVGGGEDRVFGVVGIGDAVAVGVDPVGVPGRRHELHPAERASRGDVEVGAEGGLDLVDAGQHRRALRPEPVGRRRPLVHRDQDRRHPGGGAGGRGQRRDRQHRRRAGRRWRRQRGFGAFGRDAVPFSAVARVHAAAGRRYGGRGARRRRRRQGRSLLDRSRSGSRGRGDRRARRRLERRARSRRGARGRRHRALGARREGDGNGDRGGGGRGDRADLAHLTHPQPSTLVTRQRSPFRCSISSRSSLVRPTRSSETLTG